MPCIKFLAKIIIFAKKPQFAHYVFVFFAEKDRKMWSLFQKYSSACNVLRFFSYLCK